jgi:activator of HSP90 ATPase
MTTELFSRRDFTVRSAALVSGLGIFGAAAVTSLGAQGAAQAGAEIKHDAEAIHHEVTFKASRQRVYELLTDASKFDRVVQLSDAKNNGMPPNGPATSISRNAGGTFTLFGGIISGRHIELAPNERLVQAWRPAHWKAGIYSIARFQLSDNGSGTKLVLDHTGFPKGEGQGLSDGWHKNYWEPMAKALG